MISTHIYNGFMALLILGGTGYAVLERGYSPWYLIGAVALYFICYSTYKEEAVGNVSLKQST